MRNVTFLRRMCFFPSVAEIILQRNRVPSVGRPLSEFRAHRGSATPHSLQRYPTRSKTSFGISNLIIEGLPLMSNLFMPEQPEQTHQIGACPKCGAPIYIDAKFVSDCPGVFNGVPSPHFTCTCRWAQSQPIVIREYVPGVWPYYQPEQPYRPTVPTTGDPLPWRGETWCGPAGIAPGGAGGLT
jgi:hypothetical protein